MMSGAWPPPDPSVWNEWTARPSNASIESSTKPDSFERVGVDADLYVHLVRDGERGAKHRRRGAPVLVALQADRAGLDLLDQSGFAMPVPLAEDADVDGPAFERAQHHLDVSGPRRDRRRIGAVRRARSATDQGRGAVGQRRLRLLRGNEMDMRIDAGGGQDQMRARDGVGGQADFQAGRDAVHRLRIAGLADARRCGHP